MRPAGALAAHAGTATVHHAGPQMRSLWFNNKPNTTPCLHWVFPSQQSGRSPPLFQSAHPPNPTRPTCRAAISSCFCSSAACSSPPSPASRSARRAASAARAAWLSASLSAASTRLRSCGVAANSKHADRLARHWVYAILLAPSRLGPLPGGSYMTAHLSQRRLGLPQRALRLLQGVAQARHLRPGQCIQDTTTLKTNSWQWLAIPSVVHGRRLAAAPPLLSQRTHSWHSSKLACRLLCMASSSMLSCALRASLRASCGRAACHGRD